MKCTQFSQKPITFHLSLLPVAKKLKTNRGKCNSQFLLFHENSSKPPGMKTALNHLVRLSYGFTNIQEKEKALPGQELRLFGLHPGKAACARQLIQALDFVRLGPGWLLGCPIQTSPNCGPVSDSSLGRKFEGINHQSIVWCLILLSYQYSCLFGEIVVFCARVIWLSPV